MYRCLRQREKSQYVCEIPFFVYVVVVFVALLEVAKNWCVRSTLVDRLLDEANYVTVIDSPA